MDEIQASKAGETEDTAMEEEDTQMDEWQFFIGDAKLGRRGPRGDGEWEDEDDNDHVDDSLASVVPASFCQELGEEVFYNIAKLRYRLP